MPAIITFLPGTRCTHYVACHCLFLERQNPGLRQEWRCKVVVAWEREYDKFLTQADTFNLDIRTASLIWRQRMASLLIAQPACPNYRPGWTAPEECCFAGCMDRHEDDALAPLDDDTEVACTHSWLGLCILSLPACEGMCTHYEVQK